MPPSRLVAHALRSISNLLGVVNATVRAGLGDLCLYGPALLARQYAGVLGHAAFASRSRIGSGSSRRLFVIFPPVLGKSWLLSFHFGERGFERVEGFLDRIGIYLGISPFNRKPARDNNRILQ